MLRADVGTNPKQSPPRPLLDNSRGNAGCNDNRDLDGDLDVIQVRLVKLIQIGRLHAFAEH